YQFNPATTGTHSASLCVADGGSGTYDSKIHVYTGACGGPYTCVVGNDDFCSTQSRVSFAATAGTLYLIRVSGFSANTGNFTLAVAGPPPAITNDNCASPIVLTCPSTTSSTTVGSTNDNGPL